MRRLVLALALLLAVAPAGAQQPEKFLVFFHPWSAELDDAARQVVEAAIDRAKAQPAHKLEVHGFASIEGGREANIMLSLLRAQRIADLLQQGGVASDRISRLGEGSVSVVSAPEEARRVEITLAAP